MPPALSPELYKRVRQIHIRTRRLVRTMFAGHYHSAFKGRGIEFAEVREYVPGDDVRAIDWNVTARRGQLYIKQYVEERELTVMLLVDLSASGQFGSVRQVKAEIASELCAVLALSAIMNYDRVGLILFTDQIEKFVPPQKGRRHVLRIIRDLLSFQPAGRRTNIGLALDYLQRISRRRTVSFLVSDFLAAAYERPLRMAQRRHDIIPISITDRRELSLPHVGFIALQDLETGAFALVDTSSPVVQRQYQQRRHAAVSQRQRVFRLLGIEAIEVCTDASYILPLVRFFRARERRK
jgi:uncharacterized protein (DUF58 family)